MDDWREFVAMVAVRYPKAAGLEIWNEPNLQVAFKTTGPAPRYAATLAAAYDAIKAANPKMKVISGGLSNNTVRANGNIDYPSFLDAILRLGAKGKMDAIGFHPYPGSVSTAAVLDNVKRVRAVLATRGVAGTPLWMTEIGLSTTGEKPIGAFTEQEQADGLSAVYRLLSGMPDVEVAVFHTLMERQWVIGNPELVNVEVGYGMLRRSLQPKPAYCALAALRGKPDACKLPEE